MLQRVLGEPEVGPEPPWPSTASERDAAEATPESMPKGAEGLEPVVPSAELAEGDVLEAMVQGVPVALIRLDGVVHALSGVCPHAGGPIADGTLEDGEITCPWHGWGFNVSTGVCAVDPDAPLQRYPSVELDGTIYVGVSV